MPLIPLGFLSVEDMVVSILNRDYDARVDALSHSDLNEKESTFMKVDKGSVTM